MANNTNNHCDGRVNDHVHKKTSTKTDTVLDAYRKRRGVMAGYGVSSILLACYWQWLYQTAYANDSLVQHEVDQFLTHDQGSVLHYQDHRLLTDISEYEEAILGEVNVQRMFDHSVAMIVNSNDVDVLRLNQAEDSVGYIDNEEDDFMAYSFWEDAEIIGDTDSILISDIAETHKSSGGVHWLLPAAVIGGSGAVAVIAGSSSGGSDDPVSETKSPDSKAQTTTEQTSPIQSGKTSEQEVIKKNREERFEEEEAEAGSADNNIKNRSDSESEEEDAESEFVTFSIKPGRGSFSVELLKQELKKAEQKRLKEGAGEAAVEAGSEKLEIEKNPESTKNILLAENDLHILTREYAIKIQSEYKFSKNTDIPSKFTEIAPAAFYGLVLGEVIIPNSITRISNHAFSKAWLESIILGESVEVIGEGAFSDANTGDVIIPDSVTSIGAFAFAGTDITEVIIPNSVIFIGEYAFYDTPLDTLMIGDKVKTIGDYAFADTKLTSVIIPNSVVFIGEEAFSNTPLTTLTLGANVETIADYAFYDTELTNVIIPDSVVSIGVESFSDTPLTTLILGANVETIADYAFYDTELTNVIIPNSVKAINEGVFENTLLTEITLGNSLKSIGDKAFYDTYLTRVEIPNSVQYIGESAFEKSLLNEVTLSNSLEVIGERAFYKTKLTEVTIPDSVTSIEKAAFANLPLDTLTLGKSLKLIADRVFIGTQLTEVIIPDSVESIGESAFEQIPLRTLTLGKSLKTIGEEAFANNYQGYWVSQLSSVIIPDSVQSIGEYAFFNVPLKTLQLGNSLKIIGNGAFANDDFPSGASQLTSVIIPDSVESIGKDAFSDVPLETLTLGTNVKNIGILAFEGTRLTHVEIPDSVEIIEKKAFYDTPLKMLHLGNHVENIGDFAFADTELTSVTIPYSVQSIGEKAFYNTPLKSVTIQYLDDKPPIEIADNAFPEGVKIIREKFVSIESVLEKLGYNFENNLSDDLYKSSIKDFLSSGYVSEKSEIDVVNVTVLIDTDGNYKYALDDKNKSDLKLTKDSVYIFKQDEVIDNNFSLYLTLDPSVDLVAKNFTLYPDLYFLEDFDGSDDLLIIDEDYSGPNTIYYKSNVYNNMDGMIYIDDGDGDEINSRASEPLDDLQP